MLRADTWVAGCSTVVLTLAEALESPLFQNTAIQRMISLLLSVVQRLSSLGADRTLQAGSVPRTQCTSWTAWWKTVRRNHLSESHPVLPGLLAYNRYPPHSYGNLMHRASALGEPHEGPGFHNAPTTRRLGQCYLYMGQWQPPPGGKSTDSDLFIIDRV